MTHGSYVDAMCLVRHLKYLTNVGSWHCIQHDFLFDISNTNLLMKISILRVGYCARTWNQRTTLCKNVFLVLKNLTFFKL